MKHPPVSDIKRWNRERCRAFTLVEVLVCLAVIGVLASLILAAVARAKTKARDLNCLNNLKQHGIALTAFVGDHHCYPLSLNPGSGLGRFPDHGRSIETALSDYGLPSDYDYRDPSSVQICPASLKQMKTDRRLDTWDAGYGYNAYGLEGMRNVPLGLGMDSKMDGTGYSPVHESQVVAPSQMLAMGDSITGWDGTYRDSSQFMRVSSARDELGSSERVKRRHGGMLNVLFSDGHVTPLLLDFLFADKAERALSQWNRDNEPHAERIERIK
jgi:prepilin-type N-terminal cleavage/methylation domain-containing protein/prepilin-type processing-associated H-X9-DG protein